MGWRSQYRFSVSEQKRCLHYGDCLTISNEPGVSDEDYVQRPVGLLFRLPTINFDGSVQSHLFAAPFSFSCLQILTPFSTPSG